MTTNNSLSSAPAAQDSAANNSPGSAASSRSGNWWRTGGLLLIVSFVALGAIGRWMYYRYNHVISDSALVKGRIAQVGARINGRVAEILVEENQRIRQGDLVARMEDQYVKAQLARSEAELLRAQKDFDVEKANIEAERVRLVMQVSIAESQIAAAEADCRTATNECGRMQRIQGRIDSIQLPLVVTASEVDLIATNLSNAKVTCQAAEARLKAATTTRDAAQWAIKTLENRTAHLEVFQRQVEVAAAEVDAAKAEVEATYLRAPEDGWVSRRILEVGGSARVGDPIIALWLGDRVWVEAWVDEAHLAKLEIGSPVDVRLTAYSDHAITGHVQAIGVLSDGALLRPRDAGSREPAFLEAPKFGVRIALPDNDLRVMPGLSAVVGIFSGAGGAQRRSPDVEAPDAEAVAQPKGFGESELIATESR